VKEFAFFGHTRDKQEFTLDYTSFKSQVYNYNQMLSYYQMADTG